MRHIFFCGQRTDLEQTKDHNQQPIKLLTSIFFFLFVFVLFDRLLYIIWLKYEQEKIAN